MRFTVDGFLNTVGDQTGKIVVLTGGNSGLGLEACAMLLAKGATVVFTARSEDKATAAIESILTKAKSLYNPEMMDVEEARRTRLFSTLLDVSDLDDVAKYRAQLESKLPMGSGIDVLVLNAGVMALDTRQESKQGFEMQMATNCFGQYALACHLFPLLLVRGSPSRIVSLASIAQFAAPPLHGISLDDLDHTKSYSPTFVYGESKLGNVLFARKLARLLEERGLGERVLSVACHPGITKTELFRHGNKWSIMGALGQSIPMGTTPTILAATDPKAKQGGFAGPFLADYMGTPTWGHLVSPHAWNESLQDKFWLAMEQKTGVVMPF